jgi:hypothetical protein
VAQRGRERGLAPKQLEPFGVLEHLRGSELDRDALLEGVVTAADGWKDMMDVKVTPVL